MLDEADWAYVFPPGASRRFSDAILQARLARYSKLTRFGETNPVRSATGRGKTCLLFDRTSLYVDLWISVASALDSPGLFDQECDRP